MGPESPAVEQLNGSRTLAQRTIPGTYVMALTFQDTVNDRLSSAANWVMGTARRKFVAGLAIAVAPLGGPAVAMAETAPAETKAGGTQIYLQDSPLLVLRAPQTSETSSTTPLGAESAQQATRYDVGSGYVAREEARLNRECMDPLAVNGTIRSHDDNRPDGKDTLDVVKIAEGTQQKFKWVHSIKEKICGIMATQADHRKVFFPKPTREGSRAGYFIDTAKPGPKAISQFILFLERINPSKAASSKTSK